jgi:hypothetical protein
MHLPPYPFAEGHQIGLMSTFSAVKTQPFCFINQLTNSQVDHFDLAPSGHFFTNDDQDTLQTRYGTSPGDGQGGICRRVHAVAQCRCRGIGQGAGMAQYAYGIRLSKAA